MPSLTSGIQIPDVLDLLPLPLDLGSQLILSRQVKFVLWNTIHLEWVVQAIREYGQTVDQTLLQHLSPLGWEHINLTGDYL